MIRDYQAIHQAWFETGKLSEKWNALWITSDIADNPPPVMYKTIELNKPVKKARAYICGLGLYELYINENKIGDEFLTPNCNEYEKWIQYQTYDVTEQLTTNANKIEVILGDGWYNGRIGFQKRATTGERSKYALLMEIHVEYNDGLKEIFITDTTWKSGAGPIVSSSIYDGEVYDATFDTVKRYPVSLLEFGFDRLTERFSLPVRIKEKIQPIEIIYTAKGETVLDFGQNMTGWVRFKSRASKGNRVFLQFGEVMQNGNFYRENLRTAKAEYTYISDGVKRMVRPYFTFYGFRYVKVQGWEGEITKDDFTALVLYSDMQQTGWIKTGNDLVNRLFLNALWGQKGNFLDVPTDCPQRDERVGWTGDAQIFSGTACYNMDTYAFFRKYMHDFAINQKMNGGMAPKVVPAFGFSGCSAAWGDAATIIPWNVYLHSGDKTILEEQFESMRSWVDYIKAQDSNRLWASGFHYGDWLALDGPYKVRCIGRTDVFFIASAFYYYSSMIVSKAAGVLGLDKIAKEYKSLSEEIKKAIQNEYFTSTGRLAIDTQTAHVLALFMGLTPDGHKTRIANDLKTLITVNNNHLDTGFVGTPYICRVLSNEVDNELAYTLLLHEDYPSWLYSVKMGATTIWERWNSILPDGNISDTGMNSLNHYAYGSIVEWMYRDVAGINPTESHPGFNEIYFEPKPDMRLKYAKACLDSPKGEIISSWEIKDSSSVEYKIKVPFDSKAVLVLSNANIKDISINGSKLTDTPFQFEEKNKKVFVELQSGLYIVETSTRCCYEEMVAK